MQWIERHFVERMFSTYKLTSFLLEIEQSMHATHFNYVARCRGHCSELGIHDITVVLKGGNTCPH